MVTVDTCKTPKEAWSLVHHFFETILLSIALLSNDKEKGWERYVEECRNELTDKLNKISKRMAENSYVVDRDKIHQIWLMVEYRNVSNPQVRQAIHDKEKELKPIFMLFKQLTPGQKCIYAGTRDYNLALIKLEEGFIVETLDKSRAFACNAVCVYNGKLVKITPEREVRLITT